MITGSQPTVLASRPTLLVTAQDRSTVYLHHAGTDPIELSDATLVYGAGYVFQTGEELFLDLMPGDKLYGQVDPADSKVAADSVRQYDASGASFTDETADAASAGANDTAIPDPFDTGDILYIGNATTFSGFDINIGTAGVGDDVAGEVEWEYWDGAAWDDLAVTDATAKLTATAGTHRVTFTPPSDWATNTIDGVLGYHVRMRATADDVYNTTQPLITQVWILEDATGGEPVGLLVTDTRGVR